MTTARNLTFLGAGNMARALIRGALARAGLPPSQLAATDVSAEARGYVERELGLRTFDSNAAACAWAHTIVLAVKPQGMAQVLAEIAAELGDKLVISIAAGIPIARISQALGGHTRVIRAMPNTPALVGEGATAIAAADGVSARDLEEAEALFGSVGSVVRVGESMMDAVTGLSGSGPAYVFIAIEALSDAGVRAGLPRDVATRLATQTLLGASKLALESGEHPGKLKDMVTSPGGTTIAGVAALEQAGFRSALIDAVAAATARSKELGKG